MQNTVQPDGRVQMQPAAVMISAIEKPNNSARRCHRAVVNQRTVPEPLTRPSAGVELVNRGQQCRTNHVITSNTTQSDLGRGVARGTLRNLPAIAEKTIERLYPLPMFCHVPFPSTVKSNRLSSHGAFG